MKNLNHPFYDLRSFDFLGSSDPAVIDHGIRGTIKGIGASILATGLGLAKIKAEKLFSELGFKNITAYIEDLSKTYKYDRGNIFSWLKIGETYIKYRKELDDIGFTEGDSPTKLPFLEKALAIRPKEEVFDNLMIMTSKEFKVYARNKVSDKNKKVPFWEMHGNILFIEGRRAVIINTELGERNFKMLAAALRAACRALEKKGYLVAVHLRTLKEQRRFMVIARRGRAKMRKGR